MPNPEAARILVIEDEPDLARLYREVGKGMGIPPEDFALVHSPADADKFFADNPGHLPRLILLNLQLPDEYGLTFLQRIKAEESPIRDVPVLIVTAEAQPKLEQRCQDLGASKCLIKPFPNETLREAMRSLLSSYG